MSDIHVDKLNNSQLILLVLLISLVVSAATAVATLSVVYGRLALTTGNTADAQPTVIRQTINRIIEREAVLPVVGSATTTGATAVSNANYTTLTLETIEQSMVLLHFGSQPFAQGIYITPDGYILAAEVLDKQRRYSVLDETGNPALFSVVYRDKQYSLLAPMDAHSVSHFVPLERNTDILLGQVVLLYSGSGENAQLHTGIISQKKREENAAPAVRVSVNASDRDTLAVLFIENAFAGFAYPHARWITLPADGLLARAAGDLGASQPETSPDEADTATAEIQQ